MRIDFLTIFPGLVSGFLECGLIHQAIEKRILDLRVQDLRSFTRDRHRTVDDTPYGGGPGMVFKPEPVVEALEAIRQPGSIVILTSPQGVKFTRETARNLAEAPQLVFICARYEGVDERICNLMVDLELSIGDFVTMGGEIPSLVMAEAVVRFVPGVVGQMESVSRDSFEESLLDYPHYTRPEEYRGMKVPPVLLSGHHQEIRRWRRMMSLKRTMERRPDLLEKVFLTQEDLKLLKEIRENQENQKPENVRA